MGAPVLPRRLVARARRARRGCHAPRRSARARLRARRARPAAREHRARPRRRLRVPGRSAPRGDVARARTRAALLPRRTAGADLRTRPLPAGGSFRPLAGPARAPGGGGRPRGGGRCRNSRRPAPVRRRRSAGSRNRRERRPVRGRLRPLGCPRRPAGPRRRDPGACRRRCPAPARSLAAGSGGSPLSVPHSSSEACSSPPEWPSRRLSWPFGRPVWR